MIKKITAKKILSTILASGLFMFLTTQIASAGWFDIGNVAGSAVAGVINAIGSAIGWILSVLVTMSATIVWAMIELNKGITDSLPTQLGFNVVLSIANLGFVAAIIVIAIATILRSQTYGIKQILWKLVVAALLVNFSLVFAGAIMGLADQFSNYFLKAFPGGGGENNNLADFSGKLAAAFDPQKYVIFNPTDEQLATIQAGNYNGPYAADVYVLQAQETFGDLLNSIFRNMGRIFGFSVIVISMGVLAFMLLARYVFLSVLLILMPLAWLAWIFPGFGHMWKEWWSKFLKWAFFAPIVLFFMWIVIQVGSLRQDIGNNPVVSMREVYDNTSGDLGAALNQTVANGLFDPFRNILSGLALCGLMVGGMLAARKLSIYGAAAGINIMEGAGKRFGGYVGRKGKQGAGWTARRAGADKWAEKAMNAGTTGSALKRIFTAPIRKAGKTLGTITDTGGSNLVAEIRQRSKGLSTQNKMKRFNAVDFPTKLAYLEDIMNDKEDGKVYEIRGIEQFLREDMQAKFRNYDREGLFKKARAQSGLELNRLRLNLDQASTSGDQAAIQSAEEAIVKHFRAAPDPGFMAETFFQDIDSLRRSGRQIPLGLSETEFKRMQELTAKGVASGFSPQTASKFFQNLTRGDQLDSFRDAAQRVGITENDLSNPMKKWLSGNQTYGIDKEIFGLTQPPPQSTNSSLDPGSFVK